jgi:hypothetical protein
VRVQPIGGRVFDIVDQIDCGSAKVECQEYGCRDAQPVELVEAVGGDERHEDESVLQPLVGPHALERCGSRCDDSASWSIGARDLVERIDGLFLHDATLEKVMAIE